MLDRFLKTRKISVCGMFLTNAY